MKNQIIAAFAAIVLLAAPSVFAGIRQQEVGKTQVETKKDMAKPYPLRTCIVSDDKLGEMGKPVVFVREGEEIKLCCKECRTDFDKNPAKDLKKLSKK